MKAKVVAAGGGTYLNAALAFSAKDDLKKCFWEEHPFRESGGLVWCEPDDNLFFQSIHSAKNQYQFFNSSFSSNDPGNNPLCGIQFRLPNQQRRPFPSPLSDSTVCV